MTGDAAQRLQQRHHCETAEGGYRYIRARPLGTRERIPSRSTERLHSHNPGNHACSSKTGHPPAERLEFEEVVASARPTRLPPSPSPSEMHAVLGDRGGRRFEDVTVGSFRRRLGEAATSEVGCRGREVKVVIGGGRAPLLPRTDRRLPWSPYQSLECYHLH